MLSATEKALRKLIKEQQSLNPSRVTELDGVPSPAAFSRFVAGNRPVVMRGAGRELQIPALERWSDEYLVEKLAERELDISATPEGCGPLCLASPCLGAMLDELQRSQKCRRHR